MLKKFLWLVIGIIITSSCSVVQAHGTFTWFGLRNKDTEVVIQSSTPTPQPRFRFWWDRPDHHAHHPKPKHESFWHRRGPKPPKPPKPPKHHKEHKHHGKH